MKIFISHSSANKDYGEAIIDLLRGIGVNDDEIIFTSNTAYGIPVGQNIFNWLKSQIDDKPFVIYLLSAEYYKSVACLNEMGAAWIVESEHAVLFVPDFDIDCKEFRSGALDPREIGFYLNNEERLLSFIQQLEEKFNLSKNSVIINQQVKKYLKTIGEEVNTVNVGQVVSGTAITVSDVSRTAEKSETKDPYSKFISDVENRKLKDDELLLIQYMIDAGNARLDVGWREDSQIAKIKRWEEINDLNNKLSSNFQGVVGRLQMRQYVEVSEITSYGNPRQVKLKSEIESNILDLPQKILQIISATFSKNKQQLPF